MILFPILWFSDALLEGTLKSHMDYALPTEAHLLFPNSWGWGVSQPAAAAQPGRGSPSSLQETSLKATRKQGVVIRKLTGSKLNSICKVHLFIKHVLTQRVGKILIHLCVSCPDVHRLDHVQWVLSNDPFSVFPNSVTFASSYRQMELIFQSLSTVDPFCL